MKLSKKGIFGFLRIFIFIILFVFTFISLSYIMKPVNIDLENIAGFYSEKKNSLDMVYIGGSASFVYWEPLKAFEERGIASYNYGANTVQPELYKYMIKEVLKKQSPELIVIDARAFQYRDVDQPPSEVAYRNVFEGMPYSLNRYQLIEDVVPKYLEEDTLKYNFDIIKYHGRRSDIHIYRAFDLMFQKYKNDLKGFYFVPSIESLEKQDFMTNKMTAPTDETVAILEDLLAYLKTTDTNYLFVISPYIELESHKEIFNFVEQKVTSAGFKFLDANEYYDKMNLNFDTDLYNYNHVNVFGADKYTDFLSDYLQENYTFPDRRLESEYQSWYELLPNWYNKIENTKDIIRKKIGELKYGKI